MFFDVPIAESWSVDILSLLAYLLRHSTMPIVVAVVTAMAMMTTMMTQATIAGDDCSCANCFDMMQLIIPVFLKNTHIRNTEDTSDLWTARTLCVTKLHSV